MEISPQEIISDYIPPQYTPCGPYILQTDYYNPYQVIWNGGWFYIDPFQQLFNYQRNYYTYSLDPGHYYNVTITTGAEYCYIVKSGYWDPDEDEFYYPEIIGDELLNVQGIKLIGTGDWVSAICSRWEKENPPGYYILFERDVPEGSEVIITIDDLTVGNSINYHTRIEIPLMELENRTDLDTLYHFYARFINVEAKRSEIHSQCGACWGQFPSSVRFTIEVVQGQEYGSLYDTETDEFALSFTNIETEWGSGFIFNYEDGERFKYVADGIQPDSSEPGLVTIRITPSDGNLNTIEFSFFVAYNEDPPDEGVIVIFAEQQIAPGDTTQIILKKRSSDGTLEDFSQWDSFEIGMLEGCDAGQILVGGALAPYFGEVNQPIYFVAASDLTETDTVKVRVGLIESGASRPMQTNEKDREIITLRKNTTTQQKPLGENTATYCFTGEIDWPNMGDGIVVVGDECDEEIVFAITNDQQKTSADSSEIKLLRANSYWNWIDNLNFPHFELVGDPKFYDTRKKSIDFAAATLVPDSIPAISNKKWHFGEDLAYEIFLDTISLIPENYRWIYNVLNLRVPILSDISLWNLGTTINLGDATDHTLLSTYITNESIYLKTLQDLDIQIEGVYSHQFESVDFQYFPGMLKHEEFHYIMKKRFIIKRLNEFSFKVIRKLNLKYSDYPCPTITDEIKAHIIRHLNIGIKWGADLTIAKDQSIDLTGFTMVKMKKDDTHVEVRVENHELMADKYASVFYKDIKQRIIDWWEGK